MGHINWEALTLYEKKRTVGRYEGRTNRLTTENSGGRQVDEYAAYLAIYCIISRYIFSVSLF